MPSRSAFDPVQQQRQLLRSQALAPALADGPGKGSGLQPLRANDQTRTIPEQDLQPIARFVNEDE